MDLYTTAVTTALQEFRDTYEIDTSISNDLERMLLVAGRKQAWSSLSKTVSAIRPKRRAARKRSGYNLYIKEKFNNRSNVEAEKDQNSQDLMSLYSKTWKALDETERGVYNQRAKDENQSGSSASASSTRSSKGQHRVTGYNVFYRENKDSIKENLQEGERLMAVVGARWKALSQSEKDEWNARGREETEARNTAASASESASAEETA